MALPHTVEVTPVEYAFSGKVFSFRVLRLDLIDPVYGGNKLFKLFENVNNFRSFGHEGIVTFGGAFSNHIAALAGLGQELGIPTFGIIRGEASSIGNITLSRAKKAGMVIEFVGRDEYRRYRESDMGGILRARYGNVLVVPEGGSNEAGTAGCRYIARYLPGDSSDVFMAVGTGASVVGLRQALSAEQRLWGVKVLEAGQEDRWHSVVSGPIEWISRFTFGGYAKSDAGLLAFVDDWNRQTNVPVEPIYTGKLLFGVIRLMEEGVVPSGPGMVVIHTGGLQYMRD